MKKLITLVFVLSSFLSYAQTEKLDTIYYDKDWHGCTKTFATYYRIITIPTQANSVKRMRDYFITGELQGESNYISVDRNDDSNTIFDGDVISYYKNGKIGQKMKWQDSHPIGDAFMYYENGNVKSHGHYNDLGQLDGELYQFDENGNLTSTVEFNNGIPNSYLTAYNKMGTMGHYDINTLKLITEPVTLSSLKTKIIKGDKFYYYDDKNGIYLSVFMDAVKHYGKYYRIGISIFNNTNESILFDPTQITAMGRFYKKPKKQEDFNESDYFSLDSETNYVYNEQTVKSKDIRVWTFADYTKKVHRRQQWDEALMAIGEGLAASGAGYSTATSTSNTYGSAYGYGSGSASAYGSGGYAYGSYNSSAYASGSSTTTTTTYYDATAAAIAQERASYNVATYSASLESDTQAINENYFQLTTLEPQTEVGGYVLLNKDKPQIIDLIIPINGVAYKFHFTEIPK